MLYKDVSDNWKSSINSCQFLSCVWRVWKGILGIQDLTKIRCRIRKNNYKYLDGIWDLTAPGKPGLAKMLAKDARFFHFFVGNNYSENHYDPNYYSSGQSPVVSFLTKL